jgi:pimeloyl-ACP methyl ester carboxylesterase
VCRPRISEWGMSHAMDSRFGLILFPGLGADYRLLEPQRAAFPQLTVPPWIPPHRNESLPSYAARMAQTIAVPPERPLIVGGVSFGGMLACEISRHLKADGVVLIASCRSPGSLRPLFPAARWLLPVIPVATWSIAKLLSTPVMAVMHRRSPAKRRMLVTMFKESDPHFMHWIVRAIFNWQPTPLDGIPAFHIHGTRDPIIPARRVNADAWIPGGGHLINASHADEVNRFILAAVRQCQSRACAEGRHGNGPQPA